MAIGTTTYGDINQRTAAWAAVEMLSHAEPVLVLSKFGMPKPLPKNKADTVKFRRVIPFPAITAPLLEGVSPSPRKMQYEDVTCVMKQWGDVVEITDVVADMAEDPVLRDASQQCGEQSGRTLEAVTWGVLRAGTSVIYANGVGRSAVNTPITKRRQQAATRLLKRLKAKKVTSILDGSPKFQTRSVEAAYIAVAHTDLESDIRSMAGFLPVAEYGTRKPLCPEEIGCVDDVRYILSPDLDYFPDLGGDYNASGEEMVTTSGVKADVYPIIIFGREAYGLVPLKGANAIEPKVLNPGTPRGGDPLGQTGTVGWKAYFNAVILNDAWMVRLEVACSDLG